jgi:hypothetical protein
MPEDERAAYWATMQVPYQAYYNYEEILAVFGDPPQQPRTVLAAYEQLTRYLTSGEVVRLPAMPESLRERTKQRFLRRSPIVEDTIVVRSAPRDQVWAEWITYVLRAAGLKVHSPADPSVATAPVSEPPGRPLTIVSRANAGDVFTSSDAIDRSTHAPLFVVVDGGASVLGSSSGRTVSIAGLTTADAVEQVLRLVGREEQRVVVDGGSVPRYPG